MRPTRAEVCVPSSVTRSMLAAAAAGVLWGAQATWGGPGLFTAVGAILAASAVRGRHSDWLAGAVLGMLWHGIALAWTPAAWARLGGHAGLPWLLVAWQALPVAVAVGTAGMASRRGLPLPLAAALAWAMCDGFADRWDVLPWTPAVLLVDTPSILWIAAFAGRAALSGTLMAWGALALHQPRRGLWTALALLAAGLLWQPTQTAATTVRVGVVQPNVGALPGQRPGTAEIRAAAVLALAAQVHAAGADLVVTPEGAWPHDVGEGPGQRRRDLNAAWRDGPPVLLGAPVGRSPTNSLVAITRGQITGRIDKQVLVPVAERRWAGHGADRYRPGAAGRTTALAGVEIAGWVCYEDLFSRSAAQAGDAWLGVAASNDAWLGPRGADQHLRATRLLAVLTGRWVVRAATSGPSALIDPAGRLRWHTHWVDGEHIDAGRTAVLTVPLQRPRWTGAHLDHVIPWLALWCWLGFVLTREASP